MAGLLDYLEGIGETGATLGTGLLSGVVGAPYGLFKGITSGRYGSPEAVRIAEEEAKKFMERNTYVPRGKVAQEALQKAAQLMEQSKLPPIIPEAIAWDQYRGRLIWPKQSAGAWTLNGPWPQESKKCFSAVVLALMYCKAWHKALNQIFCPRLAAVALARLTQDMTQGF
jgi:hypothetical protein